MNVIPSTYHEVIVFLSQLTPDLTALADLHDHGFSGLRDVKYRHFLEASRLIRHTTNVRADQDGQRVKRSPIINTGVKVCPQDTMKAVISSHRAYYKLRGKNKFPLLIFDLSWIIIVHAMNTPSKKYCKLYISMVPFSEYLQKCIQFSQSHENIHYLFSLFWWHNATEAIFVTSVIHRKKALI